MPTKYIRHQSRFVVFHEKIVHSEMAHRLFGRDKLIHGAGFIKLFLDDGQVKANCYGESESLRVGTRRDDHTHILDAIGVENEGDVEHAKYVIWRGKAVVFSNDLEHKAVAEAAFLGSSDCESAGFIKFIFTTAGKVKVHCYGESMSLGVSSQPKDFRTIADLMGIPEANLHFSKQ